MTYYVFYDNKPREWELLNKYSELEQAKQFKSYYNRKYKIPAARIFIMQRVG